MSVVCVHLGFIFGISKDVKKYVLFGILGMLLNPLEASGCCGCQWCWAVIVEQATWERPATQAAGMSANDVCVFSHIFLIYVVSATNHLTAVVLVVAVAAMVAGVYMP